MGQPSVGFSHLKAQSLIVNALVVAQIQRLSFFLVSQRFPTARGLLSCERCGTIKVTVRESSFDREIFRSIAATFF